MTTQLFRTASALAAALTLGGLASAQFTAVGPFTGNAFEDFGSQDLSGGPFPVCVVDRVFSGQADLCSDDGVSAAHITTGWGFGCSIFPQTGSRLFGTTGAPARYTFDTGVTRFGGYFGTNNPNAGGGTIEFFDVGGALLFSDTLTAPNDCTWTWNGWDTGGALVASIRVSSNYTSGSHMMMDGMQADIIGGSTGTEYCFCDGGGTTAPCGNTGAAGNGCANAANAAGAHLTGSGLASISSNSLVLQGSGLTPLKAGLYFQGDNAANGGNGLVFGDGLRCAVGNVLRLQVVFADANGDSATNVDIVAKQINPLNAGDTRRYQLWYRDPVGSPCGSAFNLSNGYEVVWQP